MISRPEGGPAAKCHTEVYEFEIGKARSTRTLTVNTAKTFAQTLKMMALSKELTNHSLPEIGDAFGGRDHTTVLHATRKVVELRDSDIRINEDYNNLLRTLTT